MVFLPNGFEKIIISCGRDLSKIENESHLRFVSKFCIAKNKFKFTDETKESVNIPSEF